MAKVAKVLKKRKNDLSIEKFTEYFPDEQACQDYLFRLKWPNGFYCPECGNRTASITKRGKFQCKQCKHQTTITAGTLFHKSHLRLKLWFWAIYLFCRDKRGCSAVAIKNALNISYPTAWLMLQKIRSAMIARENEYILNGIVLVDEFFWGSKKPGETGRRTEKSRAFVSLSLSPKGTPLFVKVNVINGFSKQSLEPVIQKTIEPESLLVSDSDPTLINLADFGHLNVNVTRDKENALRVLSWLHKFISNLKSSLLATYHGPSKKHLQRYFAEFCYRFNRRFCEERIFDKLLRACVSHDPITYADLTL
jgi:transposase-like protein